MNRVVAVVGLGYVGLPLARNLASNLTRSDSTCQLPKSTATAIQRSHGRDVGRRASSRRRLTATCDPSDLRRADFIIVAVPTPVDVAHIPDFSPLIGASTTVGQHMKKGAIVIYESTVYPGATEEICVPILERLSGMRWKQDFHVGYSPERVNPGDKEHTVSRIMKVVSGDDAADFDQYCRSLRVRYHGRIHKASSIKVAEAAKVIENTQRDLNIAFMNELALIFGRMNIDTLEVLAGCRHQMELPAIPTWSGRRSLHRRRPLLPDAQGRSDWLPSASHFGGTSNQRRYGRICCTANPQAIDQEWKSGAGSKGHRPGTHI